MEIILRSFTAVGETFSCHKVLTIGEQATATIFLTNTVAAAI